MAAPLSIVLSRLDIGTVRIGVKQRLDSLSGPEERNSLLAHRNQGASSGISPSTSFPKLYKKYSKSPQFDPITACHCGGNLCKNGVDDLLGVMPIEVRIFDRYPVNEFGFDHSRPQTPAFGSCLGLRGRSSLSRCLQVKNEGHRCGLSNIDIACRPQDRRRI